MTQANRKRTLMGGYGILDVGLLLMAWIPWPVPGWALLTDAR